MKQLSLFGLLVIGACSIQACTSPENRSVKGDSTAMDSSKSDSSKMSSTTPSDPTNQSKVDGDEATFMKAAALGGMMEVDLGQIAQKSTNPDVKAFAEEMVKDHSKANAELKTLAEKKKIILPTAFPAEDKAHMDMMKTMTGTAFDHHYIDMMVTDHDKTIALFKSAAASQTKEVSEFAKKTLPVITGHFEKAKAIQAKLK
jgi:putative membrane protein